MRRIIFVIASILIACNSVIAQNTTVTGPKRNKPRTTAPARKPRAETRRKSKPTRTRTSARQSSSSVSSPTGYINGHGYVDLGLSVKWATCNVGASSPESYGNYYAWGETSTKSDYSSDSYIYNNQNIGTDTACTSYDAAHVNWSGSWRMPTKTECEELKDRCTWTWTTKSGHRGYKVKGPNGNSIFLPAAGYRYGAGVYDVGTYGDYWSLTVDGDGSAWYLYFFSSLQSVINYYRYYGQSVRAVSE